MSFGGPISSTERLSFGLAQPLTVEGGSMRLNIGTGYDLATRSLIMSNRRVEARSSYRSMMLTGGYSKAWGSQAVQLGFVYDAARSNAAALVSFKKEY